jgi:hypothetical protein
MKFKLLALGSLASGITLFLWGALVQAALPFSEHALKTFKDPDQVLQVIRQNVPENGVYVAEQGLLAAVSFRPDLSDKTEAIGANLLMEFLTDAGAGLLLGLALLAAAPATVAGAARWAATTSSSVVPDAGLTAAGPGAMGGESGWGSRGVRSVAAA